MKSKRNMGMIVGGAVLGVLILLSLVMMLIEKKNFRRRVTNIKAQMDQLSMAHERDPFPVPENVVATDANRRTLVREFTKLIEKMGEGQTALEPDKDIAPLEWVTMLFAMQSSLRKAAADKYISLTSEEFQFGFERYKDGSPPVPDEVPRLAWQLAVVEELTRLLYDRGINELVSVEREEFEAAGKRMRGAQVVTTNALYETETVTFEFVARESSLTGILNKLAEENLFVVVRSMDIAIVNGVGFEAEDLERPTDAQDGRGTRLSALLMDERPANKRIVSGSVKALPVRVVMELTVYRFKDPGDVAKVARPGSRPS